MLPYVIAQIDFGYPWWLGYGHLVIAALSIAVLLLGYTRKWSKRAMILLSIPLVWSLAAFLVARVAINVNSKGELPTQNFLRSGSGRVLDIGAGTGRSSIMLLEARPQATLVALDLFAASFDSHFGKGEDPQQRLLANLKAAGVDQRTTIVKSDMRKLPFEPASFDAIISCFAIDHVGRDGATQALAEASRVLKPGGEFLLMLIGNDVWSKFAFGPMLSHGARGLPWWSGKVKDAGFQVVEEGTPPATLYVLARRS
jgi:ubiquinone/menaquinone biosynthesis C-methylase UbiE